MQARLRYSSDSLECRFLRTTASMNPKAKLPAAMQNTRVTTSDFPVVEIQFLFNLALFVDTTRREWSPLNGYAGYSLILPWARKVATHLSSPSQRKWMPSAGKLPTGEEV